MQYPIIDNLIYAYLRNNWTGLDIPETININYYQEGSGDPSPTNIRPIYPGAVFDISGVDTPVYGGVLDTVNKQLILNYNFIEISDASDFVIYTSGVGNTVFRKNVLPSGTAIESNQVSNLFKFFPTALEPSIPNSNSFVLGISGNLYIQTSNIGTVEELDAFLSNNPLIIVYPLNTVQSYIIDQSEIAKYLNGNIMNDIKNRMKLPMIHYFLHPVIDAIISAADGQYTEEEKEILRHYLTPLGIGGI